VDVDSEQKYPDDRNLDLSAHEGLGPQHPDPADSSVSTRAAALSTASEDAMSGGDPEYNWCFETNWWYFLVILGLLALCVAVLPFAALWVDDAWVEDFKNTITGVNDGTDP
jgi:hypothetical protein